MLGLGTGERANGPDYCPVGRRDDPHLRPEARRLLRRSRRTQRADAGVRRVRRLSEVPVAVHFVPITVRDARQGQCRCRDQRRRPAHAGAAGPRRGRVLPVPVVPGQLPVRARHARAGDRLPASDGKGPRDAPRHRPAHDPNDRGRSTPRPHRPHWQAGDPRRAGHQSVGRRRGGHSSSPAPGPRHRRHGAATPGALRPATLLEVATEPTGHERTRRGSASHGVPHVSRRVPATRDRPRPRRRLRPPWHRVRRRPGRMLRGTVADGGRYPQVRSPRGAQRHNARRRDSRRHRRRRRPADLPRGDHHRLHRPRRRCRRRTGRRQDVRRRRLPGRSRRRPSEHQQRARRRVRRSGDAPHRQPRTVRPAGRRRALRRPAGCSS